MTRIPQTTSRELVKFLLEHEYEIERLSGSHLTLRNRTRGTSITIPVHKGCEIGRGLAVRILKDAGFSVDEYLQWL